MDETFQEYFKKGKTPEDSTGDELVEDLKKLNFIAEGAEEMYKEGLFERVSEVLRSQEEMNILGYGSFPAIVDQQMISSRKRG